MIRIIDPLNGKQKDTIEIGVYIASSPALSAGKAYFGDYDGTLYCLNLISKKREWKIAGNDESGAILSVPALGNGIVVIGREDKYLCGYNSADGKLRWKYRTNGSINGSAVVTSGQVLFTSMDGNVYILKLPDGSRQWSFNTGAPISSSPAVIKDKFFVLTEDGRLLAFGIKQ